MLSLSSRDASQMCTIVEFMYYFF